MAAKSSHDKPDAPDDAPARNADQNDDRDDELQRVRRAQGPWRLSFSLFLLGFMLLIVAAKRSLPTGETWALRGTAAALCVAAFFVARQAQRKSKV